jgi:hypothetical protein
MPSTSAVLRAVSLFGALAGIVHLLAPEWLLRTARVAYDRTLAVDFEPRANATRRVRLVGVGFLVAALLTALLWRRW